MEGEREMRRGFAILSMVLLSLTLTSQMPAHAQKEYGQATDNKLKYLPDLVVRNVRMGDPTTGEFTVVLQNRGKGKASNCQLRLWIKDQSGKTSALVEVSQPSIEPAGNAEIKISAEKALGAYFKYEVMTDSSKKVTETNENNNTWKGNTGKV
jgi:hypothetical protein